MASHSGYGAEEEDQIELEIGDETQTWHLQQRVRSNLPLDSPPLGKQGSLCDDQNLKGRHDANNSQKIEDEGQINRDDEELEDEGGSWHSARNCREHIAWKNPQPKFINSSTSVRPRQKNARSHSQHLQLKRSRLNGFSVNTYPFKDHPHFHKDENTSPISPFLDNYTTAMPSNYAHTLGRYQAAEKRKRTLESGWGSRFRGFGKKQRVISHPPQRHPTLSATTDLRHDNSNENYRIAPDAALRTSQSAPPRAKLTQPLTVVPMLRSVSKYDRDRRVWNFTDRTEEIIPSPDASTSQDEVSQGENVRHIVVPNRLHSQHHSLNISDQPQSRDRGGFRAPPTLAELSRVADLKRSAPRRNGPFELSDDSSDERPSPKGNPSARLPAAHPAGPLMKPGSEQSHGNKNVIGVDTRPDSCLRPRLQSNRVTNATGWDADLLDVADDAGPLPDLRALLQTKRKKAIVSKSHQNELTINLPQMPPSSQACNSITERVSGTSTYARLFKMIEAACARNKLATLLLAKSQEHGAEPMVIESDNDLSDPVDSVAIKQHPPMRSEKPVGELRAPHIWTPNGIAQRSGSDTVSRVPALANAIQRSDKAEKGLQQKDAIAKRSGPSKRAEASTVVKKRPRKREPQVPRKAKKTKPRQTLSAPLISLEDDAEQSQEQNRAPEQNFISLGPFASALATLNGESPTPRHVPAVKAPKMTTKKPRINRAPPVAEPELDGLESAEKKREKQLEAELKRKEDAIAAEKARNERLLAFKKRQAALKEQIELRAEEERELAQKKAEDEARLLQQRQDEPAQQEIEGPLASQQPSEYRGVASATDHPAAESAPYAMALPRVLKPGVHRERKQAEQSRQEEKAKSHEESAAHEQNKTTAPDVGFRPAQTATATTAEKRRASGGRKNSYVAKIKRDSKRKLNGARKQRSNPVPASTASQPVAQATFPAEEVLDFETLKLASHASPRQAEPIDSDRPTTGGKTMNPEVWAAYLADRPMDIDESVEEASGMEVTSSVRGEPKLADFRQRLRSPSPIQERDSYHYSYRLLRKNWVKNTDEEDLDWAVCSNSTVSSGDKTRDKPAPPVTNYAGLDIANAAVDAEALKDLGDGIVAVGDLVSVREYRKDQHGMRQMYFETDKGFCRIKVDRELRTPEQGIKPTSKIGWLPRYAYCIMKRTETIEEVKSLVYPEPKGNEDEHDELFEVKEEPHYKTISTASISQEILTSHLTALEHANYTAAMHCLDLVHGLSPRETEAQVARKRDREAFRQALDELKEAGACWDQNLDGLGMEEAGGEGKNELLKHMTKVRVWVGRFELVGPRNF